jgi:putative glutathione S-transferase
MRQMAKPSSRLFGLDACLSVSVAIPGDDDMSSFTPDSPDRLYGDRKRQEVYALWSGGFEGRASVPMLWDAECGQVVCNESIEILKLLYDPVGNGNGGLDLWPLELRQYIDRWSGVICPSVSNDVYRYIRNGIPLQHCPD